MKITRCKTDHLSQPLGFHLERPVLSWCVEDARGKVQTAARVVVAADAKLQSILFDTGFRADIDSTGFALPLALAPRTRYHWAVTVRTDAGEQAQSEPHWFETAKMEEPWQAAWIGCDDGEPRHPLFCRELPLAGPVADARLYICGLGLYEAFLNGEKIGDEFLAPGCNNYNAWLQYQTYDITAALQKGGRLEVLLGNGWYKGRFGFMRSEKSFYGDAWKLIAEVRVRYRDGREAVFGTDEAWQVRRSRITFSNIYDGERTDATLPELPAEKAVLCAAPAAALNARYSAPVTAHARLAAKLMVTPAGEAVLDMGQNIAGIFRLCVHEPAGTQVRLQFGETLQDGCFYRDNLRTARAEYVFVSDGGEHVLQPHFTFFGARYVKLEGIAQPNAEDFIALPLSSELEKTGALQTGHGLVNRLVSNVEWSCRDNFIDVPTDCPQRDERMGWTGDAQVFCPTACYLYDAYPFYRKYLRDMATEQAARGGLVPNVIPAFGMDDTSSVWGDAAVLIPWTLYRFSGDRSILEAQFDAMKAWVDYITRIDGADCGWRRAFHFGDWLALDAPGAAGDGTRGATDEDFIADVSYMHSAELTAQAAAVLQREEERGRYEALAQRLRRRIEREFYSPAGRCCVNTQTGLLLTLRHALAPTGRTRDALRKKLADAGDKLQTGFVGTPLLCNILHENGMEDLSEKLLLNEEYPGWLHEVKLGATTVWERWNSLDENGRVSSTGMNSLNHYAYGAVLEWMYRHLAGLQPLAAGFRRVRLEPTPVWALKHLDCTYHSAAGAWQVSWQIEDATHLALEVSVPFGCTAELALPLAGAEVFADGKNPLFADVQEGVCRLSAGRYAVRYQTSVPLHTVLTTAMPVETLLRDPAARALLLRAMPQLTQLPARLQSLPMCTLAAQMGGQAAAAQLDRLDEALQNL